MNQRIISLFLLFISLFSLTSNSMARGETSDESALATFENRRALLALSGDGQWRVHMDANKVLQRTNIQDNKKNQRVPLSLHVLQIAASKTAQKVAFTTLEGCVGIVDFGNTPHSKPTVNWITSTNSNQLGKINIITESELPPESCQKYSANISDVMAFSSDGKLLAISTHIINLETKFIVATLPSTSNNVSERRILKIQFTDNNTKILLTTTTLGAGYESPDSTSDMFFSLWDLRTKKLINLVGGERPTQFVPEMFINNYSLQTGELHFINSEKYLSARNKQSPTSEEDSLLEIMQVSAHECGAQAVPKMSLTPWESKGYVIDPLGRWIALVQEVKPLKQNPAENNSEYKEQIFIFDLNNGRRLQIISLEKPILGLTSTPLGETILGINLPADSLKYKHLSIPYMGGEVVQFKISENVLGLPKSTAIIAPSIPCVIEKTNEEVRKINQNERFLSPLWQLPIKSLSNLGTGLNGNQLCADIDSHGLLLLGQNNSLYIDQYSDLHQLDWSTGRILNKIPTPRMRNVCSVGFSAAGGFINYKDDAVSFEAFGAMGRRQILDVKPGWYVTNVLWSFESQVDHFDIVWKNVTSPDKEVIVSTYEAFSKRKINEVRLPTDQYEVFGHDLPILNVEKSLKCPNGSNKEKNTITLQASHFDSFWAYRCSNDLPEIIFWTGLNIVPKKYDSNDNLSRVLALNGQIGAVRDRSGLVHIYDVLLRKALGQIKLEKPDVIRNTYISENEKFIILEIWHEGSTKLMGYSFK